MGAPPAQKRRNRPAQFPHIIGIAISALIVIQHDRAVAQWKYRGGNMRSAATVSFAMLMSGCAFLPANQGSSVLQPPLTRADVSSAKQIVVTVGDSSPVSRSWNQFRCVFQENGRCYGETTHYQEYAYKAAEKSSTITHEFPPETFREVQKLLLESKFLSLKPGPQGFIFEGSMGAGVECGGRSLWVTWAQDGCKECQPLCEYIEKLRTH
jgi:hypothetical protein